MQAHCLCRLSRASLSNAQLLLGTTTTPPGRPRFPSDLWRSILAHEQPSVIPHPDATSPAPRIVAMPPNISWCQQFTDSLDDGSTGQPQGSFRARAPSASIGVAEIAAALALASFGSVHLPAMTDPFPYAMSNISIQSPSRLGPITVIDDALSKALSARSPAPGPTADNTAADATKLSPQTAAATSFSITSNASTDADGIQTHLATTFPITAPDGRSGADNTCTGAFAPTLASTTLPVLENIKLQSHLANDSMRPAAAAATVTLADDYLPKALRPLVPASLSAYWQDVNAANLSGRLHATIYVSPKAWAQVAPTISALLGGDGAGPAGQVNFALVPLGADYAARANAAQRAQLGGGGGGSEAAAAAAAVAVEEVAAQFGLDVALAASAAACGPGGGGGGLRRLEMCPALVVRGGYMGSAGGEVSPAWSMRQDLDAHVRRNVLYGQVLRQQQVWQELQLQKLKIKQHQEEEEEAGYALCGA